MVDDEWVRYGVADGVATITFDRPDKLNALTFAMCDSFSTRLIEARDDPSVRVVVLKGNGRAFTAGVDVEDRPERQDPTLHTMDDDIAEISRAADRWMHLWTLPKPVVVKAHGYCVGWGIEIALHADLVLASHDCSFFFPSVRNGSGLPDSATAIYYLGLQWAKRLLLTGDAIDGRTAARIGLVVESFPDEELDDAVDSLARRMAALPAELLAQSKAVINRSVELMGRAQLQSFAAEANAAARQSPGVGEWSRILREQGRHEAIRWRDERLVEGER
ncbi:MAG: enoyl-CoA hydratase-related protein [Acidimicrobiales bacterium]